MTLPHKLSYKAKYPFLAEAKREFSSHGFTLESFSDPSTWKIVNRARERILDALERGENVDPASASEDEITELASFPLAVILAGKTGDRFLQRRFALAEAARAQKMLTEEDPEFILKVAREEFGMDVRLEEPPHYSVGFTDYLKSASKFNDPAWKLVNRVVVRGRVLVDERELLRLLRDRVERYVLENVEKAEREELKLPEKLAEVIGEIKSQIPVRKVEEARIKATARPEAWPPCMKAIYSKLISGEGVSHFANFALASFLLNAGVPPDEVLSIYSQRSDFDERIARYQVEHIAGLKGSRTRYTVPGCAKMKTHGLCVENGRLCGGVRNPMTYYRRMLRKVGRRDGGEDEVGEERGEAGGQAGGEAEPNRDTPGD